MSSGLLRFLCLLGLPLHRWTLRCRGERRVETVDRGERGERDRRDRRDLPTAGPAAAPRRRRRQRLGPGGATRRPGPIAGAEPGATDTEHAELRVGDVVFRVACHACHGCHEWQERHLVDGQLLPGLEMLIWAIWAICTW